MGKHPIQAVRRLASIVPQSSSSEYGGIGLQLRHAIENGVQHSTRHFWSSTSRVSSSTNINYLQRDLVHKCRGEINSFDDYLERCAMQGFSRDSPNIEKLFYDYQHLAQTIIRRVLPYEERPSAVNQAHRRISDILPDQHTNTTGDGIVLVVHAILDKLTNELRKSCVCSGFIVDAISSSSSSKDGDLVVTCAHTLEEVRIVESCPVLVEVPLT